MTNPRRPADALHGIVGAVRQIFAPDGSVWGVAEVTGPTYDRRGNSLVFFNEEAMRRVRNYPANWSDLSDAELYAVSLTT